MSDCKFWKATRNTTVIIIFNSIYTFTCFIILIYLHMLNLVFLCIMRTAVDLPTLVQLLEELKMVDNWFLFGVYLGVPVDQLRKIKSSQQGEIELCKVDMLQYWLDNSVNTSWKEVARALEQMKQLVLAASVKQRYLWPTTNSEGKSESCMYIFIYIILT